MGLGRPAGISAARPPEGARRRCQPGPAARPAAARPRRHPFAGSAPLRDRISAAFSWCVLQAFHLLAWRCESGPEILCEDTRDALRRHSRNGDVATGVLITTTSISPEKNVVKSFRFPVSSRIVSLIQVLRELGCSC